MHEVLENDPRLGKPLQGPNQWPQEVPGFRDKMTAYWQDVNCTARKLAKLCLKALGIEIGLYEAWFRQPTEFLRLLHYWPESPDEPEDSFGSHPTRIMGFSRCLCRIGLAGWK